MSLVDAIPPNWRKLLKTQTFEKTCCNINEQPHCHVSQTIIRNVFMVSSRELYWAMINQNALQPSCIKAWNQRLDIDVEKSTWEMLFVLPFRCVQNITVKEMQLKILHRFYASKSLIAKWDNETDEMCCLCKSDSANITHTFIGCTQLKIFWGEIENWLKETLALYTAKLEVANMLFGIVPYTIGNHCINHCLMYCRYFIHLETIAKTIPNISKFKKYYNHVLKTEREMYIVRNEKQMFDNLFKKINTLYLDDKMEQPNQI